MKFTLLVLSALIGLIQSVSRAETVNIPLMWERSTESLDPSDLGSIIPYSNTNGGAVSEGLALPIDPNQVVWDNGVYGIVQRPGFLFASWDHLSGQSHSIYEVRHLQATFDLTNISLDSISDVILFSPYYTLEDSIPLGDIIPINDDAFIFINGIQVKVKGTNNPPVFREFDLIIETNGWYILGSLGSAGVDALQNGLNTMDIVAQEDAIFGGMGYLELKLELFSETGVDEESRHVKDGRFSSVILHPNYPNPFVQTTTIPYRIIESPIQDEGTRTTIELEHQDPNFSILKIYDISGKIVRVLLNEVREPGDYRAEWDGRSDSGEIVSGGLYFVLLQEGSYAQCRKIILLR